jgi:MFS family permease
MKHPRERNQVALDWLNFFVANVQTGFGAFIAVYLTAHRWTQTEIGLALTVGTVTAMASQVPGGALVDAMRDKRVAAALAIGAIILSALLFALWPAPLPILLAEVLHGFASCMLAPAIAAISITISRMNQIGARLGRNARFASIGNGLAAAAMGAAGYYISDRSVFVLTAALAAPALVALWHIRPMLFQAESHPSAQGSRGLDGWRQLIDRRLIVFAGATALFQLGNAAMLPIAAGEVTKQIATGATLVIAACIMLPQAVVALLSPWVGRTADRLGRRQVLMLGLAAVTLRGVLFATITNPYAITAVQMLDGVSGACLGVLLPLVAADITRGSGRFNLCMGLIGLASGVGASISTSLAGLAADALGIRAAFAALALPGIAALLLTWFALPETRPEREHTIKPASAPDAETNPRLRYQSRP